MITRKNDVRNIAVVSEQYKNVSQCLTKYEICILEGADLDTIISYILLNKKQYLWRINSLCCLEASSQKLEVAERACRLALVEIQPE